MAPAQLVLPVARSNGVSPGRSHPSTSPAADLGPVAQVGDNGAVSQDPVPGAVAAVPVWVRRVTTTAVVAVAGVAAIASYEHMRALASVAGEDWRAWLLPISVDGLAVAASMTMLVRRRAGEPAGVLPWVALLLGLGASLMANVAAADPTVVGRVVAGWPPVGLLLSYELFLQQHSGGLASRPSAPGAVQPLERTER
jgi:hypothetical protein